MQSSTFFPLLANTSARDGCSQLERLFACHFPPRPFQQDKAWAMMPPRSLISTIMPPSSGGFDFRLLTGHWQPATWHIFSHTPLPRAPVSATKPGFASHATQAARYKARSRDTEKSSLPEQSERPWSQPDNPLAFGGGGRKSLALD